MTSTKSEPLSDTENLQYPPKLCEIIEGGPCDACTMLMDLDARFRIDDLGGHSEEQFNVRWDILRKVNQRHDPMANFLPVELASAIFKRCLSLPTPESLSLLKKSNDSEVDWLEVQRKLTSINRNWRDIACSTPDLWNSLNTTITLQDETLFAQNLATLRRATERSGNLPLALRIDINPDGIYEDLPPSSFQLFDVLCKQAHRWEYLSITAPDCVLAGLTKYATTFPTGLDAPYLSHFSFFSSNDTSWDYYSEWDPNLVLINANAHRPTPWYINTPDITLSIKFLDLSQLRQLNVGCLTEPELFRLLSHSPHMTFLECWIATRRRHFSAVVDSFSPQTVITHTAMKSFSADGDSNDIFQWITMPAVENLFCDAMDGNIHYLRDFLDRSRCSLTTLNLFLSEGTDEELINVLDLTPQIERLTIRGIVPRPRLFHHLGQTAHSTEAETSFLPYLRSFSFCTRSTFERFDWSLLRKTTPTSKKHRRPLHEICVELMSHQIQMTAEEVFDVVGLINSGIDIKIWVSVDAKNMEVNHDNHLIREALENLRAKRGS
ncbi:hypothetical protein CPB83DRAFT_853379 [Crepidotus variabilis]|uniref:F-box domain-containing protein n=1 Tax=Crepidotus variabilis TaxID=179855 RepID=A0A9P6JQI5_9AGAR|nr:hypothetical protein CPB83DRAFT_853379 [Crepidotus variabilis]